MKRTRMVVGAAVACLTAGIVLLAPNARMSVAPAAWAQNIGQRTVTGSVVEGESTPVEGATVFLKNQKTKSIRSYTSSKDGRFHFAQVNMVEDYDLWAEKAGRKSPVKTVSSWDARKNYEMDLKLK
ncbi:MAG TPA: carboxypeptidase-like regulatory domain-containing protein [Terracidiphilus sp.]